MLRSVIVKHPERVMNQGVGKEKSPGEDQQQELAERKPTGQTFILSTTIPAKLW